MTDQAYDFRTAAQWSAGVRDNLGADGDTLAVPLPLVAEPLPGTDRSDGGALLATDSRGDLLWLHPHTRELGERGVLAGLGHARTLVAGRTVLWVLGDDQLDRYARSTRQRLTPAPPDPAWRMLDVTGDGADGVWLAEARARKWRLRHVDCWGHTDGPVIAVESAGEPAIRATRDGTRLVILDRTAGTVTVRGPIPVTFAVDPVFRGGPLWFAVDTRLHLLGQGRYQLVNLADGAVELHQDLPLPPGRGHPVGLAATAAGAVVSATGGLFRIVARDDGTARDSLFITPTLVSPIGVRSGWNRAELDVILPPGTEMAVSCAATTDPDLITRANRLITAPATAGRAAELERLLPWRTGETVTYQGVGTEPERLAVLLSEHPETTLWLRIRLHTPAGGTPPRLARLRVRYPDVSLVDDLPAIYRAQPRSFDLRRILAPYEVLLDGLDEILSGLPDRLDPATAGDDRTDGLLRLLGFPPLGDLPADRRRELLRQAPAILGDRGTRAGLELLLATVTGGRATVTDIATEPAGWFLGTPAAVLGHGTIALAQTPAPARAGTLVLGDTPLGRGCPDPGRMLARRFGDITVDLERDDTVAPFVDRLLPDFAPAHCRIRVRYRGDHRPRLDIGFRLDGDAPGDMVVPRLGQWTLPRPPSPPAVLDDRPELRAGPRLR